MKKMMIIGLLGILVSGGVYAQEPFADASGDQNETIVYDIYNNGNIQTPEQNSEFFYSMINDIDQRIAETNNSDLPVEVKEILVEIFQGIKADWTEKKGVYSLGSVSSENNILNNIDINN